jgi:hypothetical protein
MIKSITTSSQLRAAIARSGYTCIIVYREHDWGSTQMRALCSTISREIPTIWFGEVMIDLFNIAYDMGTVTISYVPTLCIWHNGRPFTQVVGADIERIRTIMSTIVHGEVNTTEHVRSYNCVPNHAIMPRRQQKNK